MQDYTQLVQSQGMSGRGAPGCPACAEPMTFEDEYEAGRLSYLAEPDYGLVRSRLDVYCTTANCPWSGHVVSVFRAELLRRLEG